MLNWGLIGLTALLLISPVRELIEEKVVNSPLAVSDTTAVASGKSLDIATFGGIADALDFIGDAETTLVLSVGEWKVHDNITIPSNIELHIVRGAKIRVSSGKMFFINGSINAGLFEIFTGDGGVRFGEATVDLVYPEWFGARGDGNSNDTVSVQKAADATTTSEGTALVNISATYSVDTVQLKPGTGGITGDGTLVGRSSKPEGVLTVLGHPFVSDASPVVGILISVNIDLNGMARRGIFAAGLQKSRIVKSHIFNGTLRNSSLTGIRIHHGSQDNVIADNIISLGVDEPYGTYGSAVGIHVVGETVAYDCGYFSTGNLQYKTVSNFGHKISGNIINNGTHGIVIHGAKHVTVANNIVNNSSHRGIGVMPCPSFVSVVGNTIRDVGSSGIHIAIGAKNVVARENTIVSYKADNGDNAAIQALYGVSNISISKNIVEGDFFYGVKSGYGAENITVEGNQLLGHFTQAGIAIEAAWMANPPSGAIYSRRLGGTQKPSDILSDSADFLIANNTINAVAGIYLSQIGDTHTLKRVLMRDNSIGKDATHDLYLYEEKPGNISELVLTGFTTSSKVPTNFVLPRGWAHFRTVTNIDKD